MMILPSISTRDLIRELQNVTACSAHRLESREPSSSRSFFQAHSSRSRDSAAETGEGKEQRRKSRRRYSEVVVVCFILISFETWGR